MSNIARITPYSELIEKAQTLARDNSYSSRDKFKGLINWAYTQEIPRKEDWTPLIGSSTISCTAKYNTGTVSVTAGDTAITGVGTTWVTGMTNRKMRISGNPNVYTFTYVSGTTGTISPALSGDTDVSGASYVMFDDDYSLASDFNRFLQGGSLYKYRSGRPYVVEEASERKWRDEYSINTSDETTRCRLRGFDTSMNRVVEINPAPQTAIALPYDYIKHLTPMTEYRTGYVTDITNGVTTVTGSGADWDGYISSSYTYYFRMDKDGVGDSSVWYKVSSAGSDTALTLTSVYAGTTVASATEEYTICMIPLLPYEFQDWMIYLAAMNSGIDQNDPSAQGWISLSMRIEKQCQTMWKNRNTNHDIDVEYY